MSGSSNSIFPAQMIERVMLPIRNGHVLSSIKHSRWELIKSIRKHLLKYGFKSTQSCNTFYKLYHVSRAIWKLGTQDYLPFPLRFVPHWKGQSILLRYISCSNQWHMPNLNPKVHQSGKICNRILQSIRIQLWKTLNNLNRNFFCSWHFTLSFRCNIETKYTLTAHQ